MNEETATSDTALSLIEEKTELSLLNGQINISVIHNNVSRFTTKFQSDSLQVMHMRVAHDLITNFGRTGESNLIHIFVLSESLTCDSTITWHNVEDTGGETGFVEQFTDS